VSSPLSSILDIIKALVGIKPGQPKKGTRVDVKPLPAMCNHPAKRDGVCITCGVRP